MDGVAASPETTGRYGQALLDLWELTGDADLRRLAESRQPILPARDGVHDPHVDRISTALMNCFKNTGESAVFALLFELNEAAFLHAVQGRVRRGHLPIDAHDVVQEVFLNIYRYPHCFHASRPDAFRSWGHRIVRNTLLKFQKSASRVSGYLSVDDDAVQPSDPAAPSPLRAVAEAESARLADAAYLIYLNLYLTEFRALSPKEQWALTLVEVEGASYKAAAERLGLRLENLKMVIFRGRRKILRGMANVLGHLAPAPPPQSHSCLALHPNCSGQ